MKTALGLKIKLNYPDEYLDDQQLVNCISGMSIHQWPENQILIPDWTNSHCPSATQLARVVPAEGEN